MQTEQALDVATLYTQLPSAGAFETHAKALIDIAEANITRIESQIRDLERLRDRERGIVAHLRMAIAPIKKLPAELLVEIFLLVRDSYPDLPEKNRIRRTQELSHVCAFWRSVALTTPQLWTDKLWNTPKTTPTASSLAGIQQWLDRSAPFHIPVYFCIEQLFWGTVDAQPLVDTLATVARRWKTADFTVFSLDVLSAIPVGSLQSLEELDLCSPDMESHSKVPAFLTAEHLHSICLDTVRTSKFLLPWSQLSYITITDPDPMECLEVLVQCATLEHAVFCTELWKHPPDMSQRPMTTLNRLSFITVEFDDGAQGIYAPFITRLALPSLNTLDLVPSDSPWPSTEFSQFLLRSPNIECLAITRSILDPNNLLAALRHAPSLITLELYSCSECIDDSILVALQYSLSDTIHIAPKLQCLRWTYTGNNFSEEALDAMIQSRWWTDAQIPSLTSLPQVSRWSSIMIRCGEVDELDSEFSSWFAGKLEEYRSQGLDVQVHGYS
ncbi:hypothetical protein R3P38DRAFT_2957515 [Favolaschia claudopus]|uniref:F-box domain-containing protein n=1 Tax=Favolaschia claudopus TaxID=2862362 RepID=A0AAW0BB23_9AGAR